MSAKTGCRRSPSCATASVPPLVVTPSYLPVAGDDPSGFRRTEIARLGRDLAFIRAASGPLRRDRASLPRQPLWWLAVLAPWGLLGGFRAYLQRRERRRRDPLGHRRREALGRADGPLNLARVLYQEGRLDETLQWFERAAEADPYLRSAYYGAGLAARRRRSRL